MPEAIGSHLPSLPEATFFTATDLPLPKVILSAPSVTSPVAVRTPAGLAAPLSPGETVPWAAVPAVPEIAPVVPMPLTLGLVATMAVVSLWTPLRVPLVADRWFADQWFWRCLPVPFLVAGATLVMRRVLRRSHDATPFWLAIGLVFLGYSGLLISAYPYAILPGITLWDAAAPHSSLSFTLWGAAFIIPVILGYTMLAYWVFRGKVAHDAHYH